MTFKLIAKAKYWKILCAAVSIVRDEVTLQVGSNGLVVSIGTQHEAMFFEWPKDKFETCEADYEEEKVAKIQMPVSKLFDVIKRFSDDTLVEIVDKGRGIKVASGAKEFVCTLLADAPEPRDRRNIPYPVDGFTYTIKALDEMLEDAAVFKANEIYFEQVEKTLYYTASDHDQKVKNVFVEGFGGELYKESQNKIGFQADFIRPMLASIGKYADDKIMVQIGPQPFPLHLTFTIPEFTTIDFYLAIMVER